MSTPRPVAGARRAVAVAATGALREASDRAGTVVWACERFDGLLWQLVGLVTSPRERDAFLRGD